MLCYFHYAESGNLSHWVQPDDQHLTFERHKLVSERKARSHYYGRSSLFRRLEPASVRPAWRWPAHRVERSPVEQLFPYRSTPRLHSAADLNNIAAAGVEWGGTISVLADEHQAFGRLLGERANAPEPGQSGAIHG